MSAHDRNPEDHAATTRPTWPVFAWLQGYQRGWLRLDVIAGLTVCAILVPEGMAYAELAGVPPEYAFYAAPAALLAYAALGSSRQLVVAVSSAIAIMSAATISELAVAGHRRVRRPDRGAGHPGRRSSPSPPAC